MPAMSDQRATNEDRRLAEYFVAAAKAIKRLPDMLPLYAKAIGKTVDALPDYAGMGRPRRKVARD